MKDIDTIGIVILWAILCLIVGEGLMHIFWFNIRLKGIYGIDCLVEELKAYFIILEINSATPSNKGNLTIDVLEEIINEKCFEVCV